jgi:hypothetical protein
MEPPERRLGSFEYTRTPYISASTESPDAASLSDIDGSHLRVVNKGPNTNAERNMNDEDRSCKTGHVRHNAELVGSTSY